MSVTPKLLRQASSLAIAAAVGLVAIPASAQAQTGGQQADPAPNDTKGDQNSGADALLADIVVTGTKQSRGQINQTVPIAITAFGEKQIEALKIGDFTQIASQVPGVAMEQVTARSTVNFSIRGLGINSSAIHVAPSVGVFVNGVYMGINNGIFFDTFDVEGIEILRGPQGTLFGRNVTGGAALLNYKKPQTEADFKVRARVESGPLYNIAAAGGGGIAENLSFRVAAFYEHDAGYFDAPVFNDDNFGETTSFVVRPSIRYDNGSTDITLFGEYGRVTGDGPIHLAVDYRGATSNAAPGTGPRVGYNYNDVFQQFPGETDIEFYMATLDARQDVDFGENAAITSITGYRKLANFNEADFDGTPVAFAHSRIAFDQYQISQELRYNGTFGPATVTTGLYLYKQDAEMFNQNILPNTVNGTRIKEDVYGIFGQVDFKLNEALTLQLGGRYTHEKKRGEIAATASVTPGVIAPGTFGVPGTCTVGNSLDAFGCNYTVRQKVSFNNFSPKVSLQYQADNALFYATAQRAYRSGGIAASQNSRSPAPFFLPERQTAYEAGFKTDLFNRSTRLNGAAYLTKIKDLQRVTAVSFVPAGATIAETISTTSNPADATIKGFELELVQRLMPGLVLTGSVAHTSARYDKVRLDLTQDGAVTDLDLRQKLTRVLPWTYGIALNGDQDFDFGRVSVRASWSHRDGSYFPDFNTDRRDTAIPFSGDADFFDLSLAFEPAGSNLTFTIYGRNLGNDLTLGNFTPIGYPNLSGCACFANKGRIIGAEISAGF